MGTHRISIGISVRMMRVRFLNHTRSDSPRPLNFCRPTPVRGSAEDLFSAKGFRVMDRRVPARWHVTRKECRGVVLGSKIEAIGLELAGVDLTNRGYVKVNKPYQRGANGQA